MGTSLPAMRRKDLPRMTNRQGGFTLIEVMVSTVVLAVGLLGLAGLQAASLSSNQSAFMRTQASALAYDLADRMRSNVAGGTSGFYAAGTASYSPGCSSTAGCSPLQMAQNDLAEWNAAITTYLPLGEGLVCTDSTPGDGASVLNAQCDGVGNLLSIKIWWDDDRDGVINLSPTNTERFVISFRL